MLVFCLCESDKYFCYQKVISINTNGFALKTNFLVLLLFQICTVDDYLHCLERGQAASTKMSAFLRRSLQSQAPNDSSRAGWFLGDWGFLCGSSTGGKSIDAIFFFLGHWLFLVLEVLFMDMSPLERGHRTFQFAKTFLLVSGGFLVLSLPILTGVDYFRNMF